MEWYWVILLMFGGLLILMITGMPIAFAFMAICVVGSLLFWGGGPGIAQLTTSFFSAIVNFAFLPIPLFILMGDIIFESGTGTKLIDAMEKFMGRIPGRLSLLAIAAGVLLGSMIGVSGASISILGLTLLPEMIKRGYKKAVTLGPIVGCGSLAMLIPPSAIAVFLGIIGRISVGQLLMSIIMPGLVMATLFGAYIIIRCKLQPSLAPSYEVSSSSIKEKFSAFSLHILPTGIIILAVIGSIFMGIATPSEASALGVVACYIVAAINKNLTWKVIVKSLGSTVRVTVMVTFIIVSSISFGRILSTSGSIDHLIALATGINVSPVVILIITQIIILILGCFIDPSSIIMITVPIFLPIATALGFDPIWYGTMLIINLEMGLITPPFGLDVYTMKAVAPPDITIGDIFRSSMPFCAIGYLVLILIWVFPPLALWLPSMMAN